MLIENTHPNWFRSPRRAKKLPRVVIEADQETAELLARMEQLTVQQMNMLRLRAQGMTGAEVAETLCVERKTVKNTLTAAYKTLGFKGQGRWFRCAYLFGRLDAMRELTDG